MPCLDVSISPAEGVAYMRNNWFYIAFLLLVTTVILILILIVWGNQIASHLHPDVFKLLAALVISTGIGGIGSLVFNNINATRERREVLRIVRRETLAEIVLSYNEVKSIRRLLRAEAIMPAYSDPDAYVLQGPYSSLLQRINSAQLKLESHCRLIEGNKSQYPDSKDLIQQLSKAESYVGRLITEWEEKLGYFALEPQDNNLTDFPILRCFVSKAKRSFKPDFSKPVSKVLSVLGKSIGE